MRINPESREKRLTISEQIDPRAIGAFMANYRDPQLAILELIDNAVDNRIEGRPLSVRVRVYRNELAIFNQGGQGLDLEGLRDFFTWGRSEKTTGQKIGFFGVGGKGAMGYLGRSLEIACSLDDSSLEYRVFEPDWETRGESLKEIAVEERSATSQEGYFRAKISNLKQEVSASALRKTLADIYRPLLMDGSVAIKVNDSQIQPLQIHYLENDPNFAPEFKKAQTRLGQWFKLWFGVLTEGQQVKPGIRCYYRGRLVEDGHFFGHPKPAQLPQTSRLIGEAHLDFVPVTTNKASFDHASAAWEAAASRVHTILEPYVEKLSSLKLEQKNRVEGYEKDLAKKAKRIVEHVLAVSGIFTKKDLPGQSSGRLPPSPGGEDKPRPEDIHPYKTVREGRTAPLAEATVGEGKIKRWGAFGSWEPVNMGRTDQRADVVEEKGQSVLKINSAYPPYQTAKRISDEALVFYQMETAIIMICASKAPTVEEFIETMDRFLSDCGEVFKHSIREKQVSKR